VALESGRSVLELVRGEAAGDAELADILRPENMIVACAQRNKPQQLPGVRASFHRSARNCEQSAGLPNSFKGK
jgi:hypothetical protein